MQACSSSCEVISSSTALLIKELACIPVGASMPKRMSSEGIRPDFVIAGLYFNGAPASGRRRVFAGMLLKL